MKFDPTFECTSGLFQVTLTVYYRILNFEAENAELSRIYNLKESIVSKYIFDLPKLFELIEVYGESNPDIVRSVVKSYIKLVNNFYSQVVN